MKTSLQALDEYNEALENVHNYDMEVGLHDRAYHDLQEICNEKLIEYFNISMKEESARSRVVTFLCILLSLATAFFIICGIIMLTR